MPEMKVFVIDLSASIFLKRSIIQFRPNCDSFCFWQCFIIDFLSWTMCIGMIAILWRIHIAVYNLSQWLYYIIIIYNCYSFSDRNRTSTSWLRSIFINISISYYWTESFRLVRSLFWNWTVFEIILFHNQRLLSATLVDLFRWPVFLACE